MGIAIVVALKLHCCVCYNHEVPSEQLCFGSFHCWLYELIDKGPIQNWLVMSFYMATLCFQETSSKQSAFSTASGQYFLGFTFYLALLTMKATSKGQKVIYSSTCLLRNLVTRFDRLHCIIIVNQNCVLKHPH